MGPFLLGKTAAEEAHSYPRTNFNTLLNSVDAVFQLLTGEDWDKLMYSGVLSTGWWSIGYFILCVLLGKYVILSLFLAIIVANFREQAMGKSLMKALLLAREAAIQSPRELARLGVKAAAALSPRSALLAAAGASPGKSPPPTSRPSPARARVFFASSARDVPPPPATAAADTAAKAAAAAAAAGGGADGGSIQGGQRATGIENAGDGLVDASRDGSGETPWLANAPSLAEHEVEPGHQGVPTLQRAEEQGAEAGVAAVAAAATEEAVAAAAEAMGGGALGKPGPGSNYGSVGGGGGGARGCSREMSEGKTEPSPPESLLRHPEGTSLGQGEDAAAATTAAPPPPPPGTATAAATDLGQEARGAEGTATQGPGVGGAGVLPSGQGLGKGASPSTRRRMRTRAGECINRLVGSRCFEGASLALIVVSSIFLMAETPSMDPSSTLAAFLDVADWVTTIAMAAEVTLRFAAHAREHGAASYLRVGWNALDILVVAVSAVGLALPYHSSGGSGSGSSGGGGSGTSSSSSGTGGGGGQSAVLASARSVRSLRGLRGFRTVRALRALRPMRLAQRNPGMRRVVATLARSLPALLDIGVVLALFYLAFGVMAVDALAGKFRSCDVLGEGAAAVAREGGLLAAVQEEYGLTRDTYVKPFTRTDCEALNGTWEHTLAPRNNFDNIGNAMLTLFEVSTLEGWVSVMTASVDATEVDQQPVEDWRRTWSLFYMLFIVVAHFFLLNLFVGSVARHYRRFEFVGLATEGQRQWVAAAILAMRARLRPPRRAGPGPVRRAAFAVVSRPAFDRAMCAALAAYLGALLLKYRGEPAWLTAVTEGVSVAFAAAMAAEVALKAVAFGPGWVVESGWNMLDALLVALSCISLMVHLASGSGFSSVANLARAARVVLLLRQVQSAKSLQTLIETLVRHLPGVLNVCFVLLLVLMCYSILGVQLFGLVALQDTLDSHANFQDFFTAFVTLFRCATGESWNGIMSDCMLEGTAGEGELPLPYGDMCVADPSFDQLKQAWEYTGDGSYMIGCGPGPVPTVLYFVSFQAFTALVVMNLFVALLVEAFHDAGRDRRAGRLSPEQFSTFCAVWSRFDPKAEYLISWDEFRQFLLELDAPLGLRGLGASSRDVTRFILALGLKDYGGRVYMHEACLAAVRRCCVELDSEGGGRGQGNAAAEILAPLAMDLESMTATINEHSDRHRSLRRIVDKVRPLQTAVTGAKQLAAASIQRKWRAHIAAVAAATGGIPSATVAAAAGAAAAAAAAADAAAAATDAEPGEHAGLVEGRDPSDRVGAGALLLPHEKGAGADRQWDDCELGNNAPAPEAGEGSGLGMDCSGGGQAAPWTDSGCPCSPAEEDARLLEQHGDRTEAG